MPRGTNLHPFAGCQSRNLATCTCKLSTATSAWSRVATRRPAVTCTWQCCVVASPSSSTTTQALVVTIGLLLVHHEIDFHSQQCCFVHHLPPTHTDLTIHIDLLFTGGRSYARSQTQWAWRDSTDRNTTHFGLNYSKFSVVYDSRTVVEANKTDLVSELYNMPKQDPERFRALRLGVARAAAHMRYAMADCGSPHCDAFESFKTLVVARGLELGEGKKQV